MLDINYIRENAKAVDRALAKRGHEPVAENLLMLDEKRRALVAEVQDLQTRRNEMSKKIGQAVAEGDTSKATKLKIDAAEYPKELLELKGEERKANDEFIEAMNLIPNLPLDDVPVGEDETANVELRQWGEVVAKPDAKQHFDIGEALGLMDFEIAAKLSGARFVVLQGQLARLERALGNFMLDLHTQEFGYREISPPTLVRNEAVYGTGQLPKFKEDLFRTEDGLWLIPTAEVPLTNLVREQILAAENLPLRFTAFTPCFRSEAGSAGRDTRGMIRQHQFSKVELVSVVMAEEGTAELERMTQCAEAVLQKLNLPYRIMLLSTGDMGFAAQKTYDIEVWLPGQNTYREISSCSLCGDFQARRMQARYRLPDDKKTHFVHTLNGSGLAVGRTLIAVLENNLQPDGRVAIPDVLQPYMGGVTHIESHKG